MAKILQFFPSSGWRAAYLVDDCDSAGFVPVIGWALFDDGEVRAMVYSEIDDSLIQAGGFAAMWKAGHDEAFLGLVKPGEEEGTFHERAQELRKEDSETDQRDEIKELIQHAKHKLDLTLSEHEAHLVLDFFGSGAVHGIPTAMKDPGELKAFVDFVRRREASVGRFASSRDEG